jgi:hypothetical protein
MSKRIGDLNMPSDGEQEKLKDELQQQGLHLTESGYATWSKEHGEYPRNWSTARKTYDIVVVLFLEFYTSIISTTGPSAASSAMNEFQISRVFALFAFNFM